MKFVCRQLYKETSCRELTFNTLVLRQLAPYRMEPTEQLLEFERLCSPTKFCWIEQVELHIKALAVPVSEILGHFSTNSHLDVYVRAARWCRQHPEVDVKYVLNAFSWQSCHQLGSRGFIDQGIVLLKALRNIDVGYLESHPGAGQELVSCGERSRGRRKKESWYASNLKFYPSQSIFDEERFRSRAGTSATGVEGGVNKWVEVASSWTRDGF